MYHDTLGQGLEYDDTCSKSPIYLELWDQELEYHFKYNQHLAKGQYTIMHEYTGKNTS